MKRPLRCILPLLAVACIGTARAERVTVYGGVESFNWKEKDPGGTQLLEESGPLFAAGIRLEPTPRKIAPALRAELFGGVPDYDGQRQNGEPVQDRTGYFGSDVFLGVSLPLWKRTADDGLCLIAGGWSRSWLRNLGLDDSAGGGYTEQWLSLGGRAGLGWYAMRGPDLAWFAEAGASLPVYTSNTIEFEDDDIGKADLEPGIEPGFYAETGLTRGRLFLSLYVTYEHFAKSDELNRDAFDPESGGAYTLVLFQPESERVSAGVRAGMTF